MQYSASFYTFSNMSNSPSRPILTLTDRQKHILAASKELQDNRRSNKSVCEKLHKDIAFYTTLYKEPQKHEPNKKAVLMASDGKGRRQQLTTEEEKLISDAKIEFGRNRTPLDRDFI